MLRGAEAAAGAGLALLLACCGSGPGITPIRTAFNKGVFHHSRGELDAAIAEYRDALAEDEHDLRARFNLAAALDEQAAAAAARGDAATAQALVAEAEAEYRRVLAQEPGNVRAEVNLAALEHERGDQAAAEQRLLRAITEHDDLALPRTALALRLLEAGKPEEADALLAEALAREPTDLGANLLRGQVLARLGRADEARAALRTALAREPDDPGALLALAGLEAKADRTAEALALVDQVLLQNGSHLPAHLLAAELHEGRGELEDAVFHLWRARELDQGARPRTDYQARLRDLYGRLLAAAGKDP